MIKRFILSIFLLSFTLTVRAQFDENIIFQNGNQSREGKEFIIGFDADNSGNIEIIARESATSSIVLLTRQKDKTFQEGTVIFPSGKDWTFVKTGDINGDGYLDLIVYQENEEKISWLENQTGTVPGRGTPQNLQFASSLKSVAADDHLLDQDDVLVRDVDGDGKDDIVVGLPDKVGWYKNTDSEFSSLKTLVDIDQNKKGSYVEGQIDMVDLDGDKDLDIAFLSENKIYVGYNQSGEFTWEQTVSMDTINIGYMFFGDMNQDGYVDLILSDQYSWTGSYHLLYFTNDKKGNFTGDPDFINQDFFSSHLLQQVSSVFLHDIDQDGDMDLFLQTKTEGCDKSNSEKVLGWIENQDHWTSAEFHSIATGVQAEGFFDLDVDGDIDVVAAGEDFVYFYENHLTLEKNKAPQDILLSDSTIAENQAVGTLVGTIETIDPDDTHTYVLVSGEGSEGNNYFTVSENKLLTNEIFDYKSKSSYSIRLRVTDSQGQTLEKSFVISIEDVDENQSPVVLHPIDSQTVLVGEEYKYIVPDTIFSDSDDGDTLTYSAALENSDPLPAWLSFNAATKAFTGIASSADTLEIQVIVQDKQGHAASNAFTLIVENVTALHKDKESFIKLYPNPIKDKKLILDITGINNGIISYRLWDLRGKAVVEGEFSSYKNEHYVISLQGIKAGAYIIELRTGDLIERERIVVQ